MKKAMAAATDISNALTLQMPLFISDVLLSTILSGFRLVRMGFGLAGPGQSFCSVANN
jgi:hypothetical protein